jgi:ADP-ribose pyrophosphatase YjhB (NUDIX family)
MPEPTLHCTFCGSPFAPGAPWPKACLSCRRATYRNPIPVAVLLLPVLPDGSGDAGLLVIRRGIEPARGRLALPGGYVDFGEDWRVAAARELQEEAGIEVVDPSRQVRMLDALSNPTGDRVLLFGVAPAVRASSLPPFSTTNETSERLVIQSPQEMAFSTHTEIVSRYFAERATLVR